MAEEATSAPAGPSDRFVRILAISVVAGLVVPVFVTIGDLDHRIARGSWDLYRVGPWLYDTFGIETWPALRRVPVGITGFILVIFFAWQASDLNRRFRGRRLPAWLWPRRGHDETNIGTRLGRVLHWLAILLALVPAVFSFYPMLDWRGGGFGAFILLVSLAFACLMIGRTLRYILADE